MPEPISDRELAGLEAALQGLAPAPAGIDSHRLFFRAGQVSVRKRHWLWPAAATFLALTSGSLALLLAIRPAPLPSKPIIRIIRTAPEQPPAPLPPPPDSLPSIPSFGEEKLVRGPLADGYLRRRNQVLRWGVDALPSPPPMAGPAPRSRPTEVHDFSDWLPNLLFLQPRGSL